MANAAGGQILGREESAPRIVEFNLVAADLRGQPVGDLTSGDLQIFDNGKPQKIALFWHSDTRLQQTAPLRPGEATNRVSSNVPRATLILFDLFNESMSARTAALADLARCLQSLESAEYLYVYLLTQDGRLYPVRGLPGPEGEPADAGEPWNRNSKVLLEQAVDKVYRLRATEIDVDTRLMMTYRVLGEVAAMLAGIPGRKNLVWITHGVPLVSWYSGIDYTALLEEMSMRFDQSNVAIYPIQQTPPGMSASAPDRGLESRQTLQQFADLTGGAANSTGSIPQIVRQAISDARSSYLVGYYPPAANWDGRFHKLKIACARKGVRIQAKTGYYAGADQGSEEATLNAAGLASFDAAEIEIRGKVSNSLAGAETLQFDFRIDPARIRFIDDGGRPSAHLALQIATYAADGEAHHTATEPLDVSLPPEGKSKLAEDWIRIRKNFNVSNVSKLRLIVYDRSSHMVGSLTIPLGGEK